MGHGMDTGIHKRATAERFYGAGGDDISVRLVTEDDDPVTVVESLSSDRDWLIRYSHRWDELTYVLEGTMEFRVGDMHSLGGRGTPRGRLTSVPRPPSECQREKHAT